MKNTLGSRIRKLRNDTGLSQKEFGKLFNLAESTIGMYERDERKPGYEILQVIADHFTVTREYLLSGEEKQKTIDSSNEEKEFERWLSNPADERFFEEYNQAPEERRAALREMWEILKKQGKN